MTDFSKILNHPDKQEIISKLVSGITPKDVSNQLKLKYTKKKEGHLRVPSSLLQEFINKYLDVNNTVEQDLEAVKNDNVQDGEVSEALLKNTTYQKVLEETAKKELNIEEMAIGVLKAAEARLEQIFDIMQENPRMIGKYDNYLLRYFDVIGAQMERADRIKNAERPDKIIQHNVTMDFVNDQAFALQEAIRRVLYQMTPEDSTKFIELFNKELNQLKPKKPDVVTLNKRLDQAEELEANFEKIDEDFEKKLLEE